MPELLRGKGAELGARTGFPIEQRTMLHVLDAQARERPDATWIVVDGSRRLTLAVPRPRRTGSRTRCWRTSAPSNVALFMRNQIEFMPSLYGVQSAGGVAVPLNADCAGCCSA